MQKKQIVNRSITTMPTNVSNTDKTNDKPKSKSKPGKVIEGWREDLREVKNR